ncbi:rod shape-determining protein MreD [Vagococcus intermedius]|nr:rod shape-determining protein MreD [Vagococcus intermedius]WEG75525.1 rod shape-determining protein MreD [Vagococcus intermedius]
MTLPIILVVVMLLDGQISNNLRLLTDNTIYFNSHLLLLGLILASLHFSKRYMMILSVCVGILFDVYYYSLVGINMVSLPLTVLLIYMVFKYIEPSIVSISISLVVFITIMDTSAYMLPVVFKLINGNIFEFIAKNLGPTLLFNVVMFLLLVYPLKKIITVTN